MEDNRLSKIEILVQQKRYSEAERIIKDLLAEDSSNIPLMALLAEINLEQDRVDTANDIINNAIGLSPTSANLFYLKSRIEIQKRNYDEAEKNIQQAVELDAHDADYFAFWAHIKLARKQYEKALDLANQALEIDAENLLGLNTRSTTLLKLNRAEESFSTIDGALREDPNNTYTHANYGWSLLEKGNQKKALDHFKESLKNDPNYEYAKAGMIEALKANNPIYKLFLKYAFFMNNLTSKYQWGVIIGFYFGFKALRTLAKNNIALQPYLNPFLIVLGLFAFSTWVINPISNLFLRFNAYGKYLLDKKETMSSNFVAVSFVTFSAGILLYFILNDQRFFTIALFGFSMMVPLSVMFSPTKYKNVLYFYTVAMAVTGIAAIGLTFRTGELFTSAGSVYLLEFVAFQWLANFVIIKESNV